MTRTLPPYPHDNVNGGAFKRVRIDGVLYEYDDATEDVVLERTTSDIEHATRGDQFRCMDAWCAWRMRKHFPHPVLAVAVSRRRAYVQDQPGHVVRYMLSEKAAREIAKHDEQGVAEPGEVVFRAPVGRHRGGQSHMKDPNKPIGRKDGSRGATQVPMRVISRSNPLVER